MHTIFTKIIDGEIPCFKIAENDDFLAFLDVNPLVEGHTLVVPKLEVDYLFDLPENLLSKILPFAQTVAAQMKRAINCQRIGVTVIGLEVPHAHVHLIPINDVADMNFSKPKLHLNEDRMKSIADKIVQA